MKFGLLLPHFGTYADRSRLLHGAKMAEELGFDSLWVRDHLAYMPHEYEDPDRTFLDPFLVLSAVGAVTDRVVLGTAVLTPHRNPIHLASLLNGLQFLAGQGRVIAGLGLGNWKQQLELAGYERVHRGRLVSEQVEILNRLWRDSDEGHAGEYFNFPPVHLEPRPKGGIPIYAGGNSEQTIDRAVEYGHGWLPGRVPAWRTEQLVRYLSEQLTDKGRADRPEVTMTVLVSPGSTVADGVAHLDCDRLVAAQRRTIGVATGNENLSALDELDGAAIAGPPDEIIGRLSRYSVVGVDHVVLDLRAHFGDFEERVANLAREVLPAFQK